MASIVVRFEPRPEQVAAPDRGEPAIVAVHAARADTDVQEDPLPGTRCGRESAATEHSRYRPAHGEPRCPSAPAGFRGGQCERALLPS
ncbi:hypothetical protein [Kitasatospora purpeofusca]|uniref:hypothetical protein n=1 Tax=Kitasatospora purpeofusca TaxID=67352 RepID=UPI003804D601